MGPGGCTCTIDVFCYKEETHTYPNGFSTFTIEGMKDWKQCPVQCNLVSNEFLVNTVSGEFDSFHY